MPVALRVLRGFGCRTTYNYTVLEIGMDVDEPLLPSIPVLHGQCGHHVMSLY